MTYTLPFDDLMVYFLTFCRLGGLIAFFPGLGESYVPVRIRLIAALVLCLILTPLIQDTLPSPKLLSNATVFYVLQELLIGILLGLIGRMVLASLHVAASIIGLQSSLSSATMFNPALGTQDNVISTALIMAGTTLIFVSDLHYKVIEAFLFSYDRFPPEGPIIYSDLAKYILSLIKSSFIFGIQLSLPFMITGLFLNFCLGLLNRLMPQLQVFFIAMPLQILLMLTFLGFTVALILNFFSLHFVKAYTDLL